MRGLKFDKTANEITKFIELSQKYKKNSEYVNIKLLKVNKLLDEKEKNLAIKFWNNFGVKRVDCFEAPISRAGNINWLKIKSKKEVKGCKSIWRDEMMHILYNGDVVLCCMDWKRKNILGNVNEQNLSEIWTGQQYLKTENMIKGNIKSPANFICKNCEESI